MCVMFTWDLSHVACEARFNQIVRSAMCTGVLISELCTDERALPNWFGLCG